MRRIFVVLVAVVTVAAAAAMSCGVLPFGLDPARVGVNVPAGQTFYLRVYPYNGAGAVSGKSVMLANVVISGVTN